MAIKERINTLTFTDNPDTEYQINDATGENSFAYGTNLEVTGENQVVFGKNNADKEDLVFAIGNGSSTSDRKNILEVYTDGKAMLNGKPLYTGEAGVTQTTASAIALEEPILFSATLNSNVTENVRFDGTVKNIEIPVSGILPIEKGGTGSSEGISALVDLEISSDTAVSLPSNNKTIPIKGILPLSNGGTGKEKEAFREKFDIPFISEVIINGEECFQLKGHKNEEEAWFLTSQKGFLPPLDKTGKLGTENNKFQEVHAEKFYGNLQGTAEVANKLNYIYSKYNSNSDSWYIHFASLKFKAPYNVEDKTGGQYADMPIKFEFTLREQSTPIEVYINFYGVQITENTRIKTFNVNNDIEIYAKEIPDDKNHTMTVDLYCKLKGYDRFTLHNVILSTYYQTYAFEITYPETLLQVSANPNFFTSENSITASKGLPIHRGGTGATTALAARKALGCTKTESIVTGYLSADNIGYDGASASASYTFNASNKTDKIISVQIMGWRGDQQQGYRQWCPELGTQTFVFNNSDITIKSDNNTQFTITATDNSAAKYHLIITMN